LRRIFSAATSTLSWSSPKALAVPASETRARCSFCEGCLLARKRLGQN
jgi:hypothetical protein